MMRVNCPQDIPNFSAIIPRTCLPGPREAFLRVPSLIIIIQPITSIANIAQWDPRPGGLAHADDVSISRSGFWSSTWHCAGVREKMGVRVSPPRCLVKAGCCWTEDGTPDDQLVDFLPTEMGAKDPVGGLQGGDLATPLSESEKT
ncbi:hypothetical protein PAPYR_6237 [Paratrimastix pyriformis]|uniref:Uncharacterized protein n=1 Tax=Paratrimastix pyriformis TaxID=342808 RepID=A0ABQ8ULC3_9EUKA|nr:hypothetical protein PAPYR_6237 [Paratrimastix pyriformis]